MALLSRITTLQREAITALGKLLEIEGLDATMRAYGWAVQDTLLNLWARKHGLKKSPARPCIQRLLEKKCGTFDLHPCAPPHTDHPSLWLKNGKPYCYVSQPYGLPLDHLKTIMEFCEKHGLTFDIDAWPGWHFPHRVLFLTFVALEGENGRE
jgi:hypothetical protein